MMKKGFTLAEVLITLGIIGVVSALTIPTLSKRTGSVKIGPSLLKFKNSIENAFEHIKEEEMSSSLSLASIAALPQYMHMSSYDTDSQTYTYTSPDGNSKHSINSKYYNDLHNKCNESGGQYGNGICEEDVGLFSRDSYASTLNDGMVVIINPETSNFKEDYNGNLKGIIAEVLVDIDGDNGKNKAGKDVFAFLLDKSGVLVPYGSQEIQQAMSNTTGFYLFYGSAGTSTPESAGAKNSNCVISGSSIPNALACTGKIAENGWNAKGLTK